MTALTLTTAQRKQKRSDAHHLQPVVIVGGDGLSPAVVREVDAALTAHGLIKVKLAAAERTERDAMLDRLADELSAAPVQHIGRLLVLWRPMPEKEQAPRDDRMPGPRLVKLVTFAKSGNHRPQVRKVKVLGNQRVTAAGSIKRAKSRPQASVKKRAQG